MLRRENIGSPPRRTGRWLVVTLALLLLGLAAGPARGAPGASIGMAFVLREPLLPEPRLELDASLADPRLTIGLPLGVGLPYRIDPTGADLEGQVGVFAEPQLRWDERQWRVLAGVTGHLGLAALHGLGLSAEAGGLLGQDGSGGFVGGSLVPFAVSEAGIKFFCLGWRTLFTTEGTYHQLYLDLLSFQPGG